MASILFDKPTADISKLERYASKRIVHGSNYGAEPARISDALLEDGFTFDEAYCRIGQQRYFNEFPGVENGYQLGTRMVLVQCRMAGRVPSLRTSWGREIEFRHERLAPDLYRRAYAWRPQSEIGDLLNQWGLIPTYEFIKAFNLKSRINLQVHDELVVSTMWPEAWDLARLLRDSLERPRSYDGVELSIPVEFALETRYHDGDAIEFKRLPDEAGFKETFDQIWAKRLK